MSYNSPVLTLDLNPFFWEGIIGAWRERKREMCPHVSGLHGTNVLFIWQQCTSTKISKNKKKKMKKKLKKQIEKQQQQQDEIEQGMLEENEEASDKETEKCCSNSMENCTENSTNCEQNDNELESNQLQEETVENLVDCESVENSEDLSGQSLQQKCIVTNDDMSVTEEQNEPGTQQLIVGCFHLFYFLCQGVYWGHVDLPYIISCSVTVGEKSLFWNYKPRAWNCV